MARSLRDGFRTRGAKLKTDSEGSVGGVCNDFREHGYHFLRPSVQYCANWEKPVHGLEGTTLLLANRVERDDDKHDSQKYSRNHLRLLRHAFVVS